MCLQDTRIEGVIRDKIYNCLIAIGDAIEMNLSNPVYHHQSNSVSCDEELDLTDIEEMYGCTQDFIIKFFEELEDIDDKLPTHVPSMEFVMRLISSTGLGAKAFGFIDEDRKIINKIRVTADGGDVNVVSGIDAVKYLIKVFNEERREEIYDRLSLLFEVNTKDIKETIENNGTNYISFSDFIKLPVTTVLEFTFLLNLPIQALFNYRFYSYCDNV